MLAAVAPGLLLTAASPWLPLTLAIGFATNYMVGYFFAQSLDTVTKVVGKGLFVFAIVIGIVVALFLASVAVAPSIFIAHFHFSQATYRALGGTSVLIVVGVALQTMRQMESQMVMRHYEGFLR